MKKQVYEINDQGYLKEIYVAQIDGNGKILDKDKINLISIDPPHGLFKAKWTGTEWIEGATQEEINEMTKVEPSPPTELELLKERLNITEQALTDLILGGM